MAEFFYFYWLFVKIGFFTFGGGYAMIPLFQTELVTVHKYMTQQAFADLVSLAQVTQGPVGLNAATYTGFERLGVTGALAGTLGVITVSLTLGILATMFFNAFKNNGFMKAVLYGVRPATIGLIAAAVVFFAEMSVFTAPLASLWNSSLPEFGISWRGFTVFALALIVQIKWNPNIIFTILGGGLLSVLLSLIF